MGLLDQKERIIDLILTDKGRELLSKGLLDFRYYAFSDEGVDYKVLSDKSLSGSLDDTIHRNIAFEADLRSNSKKQPVNDTLKTFLFTIPSGQEVVPEFVSSLDDVSTTRLVRKYYTLDLDDVLEKGVDGDFVAVVGKFANLTKKNSKSQNYIIDQFIQKQRDAVDRNESTVGMMYDRDHFVISSDEAMDVVTGAVDKLATLDSKTSEQDVLSDNFFNKVDVVVGQDSVLMDLNLKDGVIKDGFLIEIFESGSDGYTRLQSATVKNPALGKTISEGYDLFLEVTDESIKKTDIKRLESRKKQRISVDAANKIVEKEENG